MCEEKMMMMKKKLKKMTMKTKKTRGR